MKTVITRAVDPTHEADTLRAEVDPDNSRSYANVYVYPSDDDGVPVVQIDSGEDFGRFRVAINDNAGVYDGDPERPGPHHFIQNATLTREQFLDYLAQAYHEVYTWADDATVTVGGVASDLTAIAGAVDIGSWGI